MLKREIKKSKANKMNKTSRYYTYLDQIIQCKTQKTHIPNSGPFPQSLISLYNIVMSYTIYSYKYITIKSYKL